METAAQLIVHSAIGHRPQGGQRHIASFFIFRFCEPAEQEIQRNGSRKFGRTSEAAVGGIKRTTKVRVQAGVDFIGDLTRLSSDRSQATQLQ